MPEGLDALGEAPEYTPEKLTYVLPPCIWFWDVLIMHAWICCFHCIQQGMQFLKSLLPITIYHLPCPLLCPPCLPIFYPVSKHVLTIVYNRPNRQIRLILQCAAQLVGYEGRGQLSMLKLQFIFCTCVWTNNFGDLELSCEFLFPSTYPPITICLLTNNCVTPVYIRMHNSEWPFTFHRILL